MTREREEHKGETHGIEEEKENRRVKCERCGVDKEREDKRVRVRGAAALMRR